jgi:signal transduction histidine kinase
MAERVRKQARMGTRLALVAGFGGVLALMTAGGIDSIRALHLIETQNTDITRQYLKRHNSLEDIRSSLYLSNTFVRDYLLEPTPEGARAARIRLEGLRDSTLAALREYLSASGPQEAELIIDLSREVDEYWGRLSPVFRWTPEEQQNQGYRFLETQVFPRRVFLIAIADKIDAVNVQTLRDGNQRSAQLFHSSRNRVIAMLGLTLAIGLLLAGATIVHILRIEKESRVRFEQIQRTQDELKRLSARLVEAQEQERRAISRELHDEVGQSLNALLVDLGNLRAITSPEDEEARQLLEMAKSLADQSVKALRNMALLLRPSMLDDLGLLPALHWQAREVSRRTGMRIDVDADEAVDGLPEEHRTCIYRVVQEALHNSSRHAGAKTVRISIRQGAGKIVLSVRDDGRGFDAVHVRGLGLIGMEERVKYLGGTFRVHSRAGEGTVLTIDLPVAEAQLQATGAEA